MRGGWWGWFAIFGGVCNVLSVSNSAGTNERYEMDINQSDQAQVLGFFQACAGFLRGTWSAKRGAKWTNKQGTERPLFDIIVPSGQINGKAEVGRVVLVHKAKGGVALFRLIEELESAHKHTSEGVSLTTWRGELVQF